MAVRNVHERLLRGVPAEQVGALVDGLAGPDDRLWPGRHWPAMRLHGPLAIGAAGGHGPIRYTVEEYVAGRWARFRFDNRREIDGFHEFTVHEQPEGTLLQHTLSVSLHGQARLGWPLVIRWLHDALLEELLDNAERATTGTVTRPARWSSYVRMLRRLLGIDQRETAGVR
jgi:hypothetical protein